MMSKNPEPLFSSNVFRVFILPRDQLLTYFFSGHIILILCIHNYSYFMPVTINSYYFTLKSSHCCNILLHPSKRSVDL